MSEGQRDGWSLLILVLLTLGTMSESRGSVASGRLPNPDPDPEQAPAGLSRPVLQPSDSVPLTGSYTLQDQAGRSCLKTSLAVEYMVMDKQKLWYFNLDPVMVKASGHCGQQDALLSLTLPDNTASLQFTFKQEGTDSYVTELTAHISPSPVCKDCESKDYPGVLANERLFQVSSGQSFKCSSQSVLVMSAQLTVKLGPVQIQAFNVSKGQYGMELECWADFNKRVIPIIIGSVAVGVILITLLTYLVVKGRYRQGYERI